VTDNPFTVLTAVVAPAILTNACSVLALGTSNRVARAVDQTRVVLAEVATQASSNEGHERRTARLAHLRRRSRLLLGALRLIYAALAGFASSALLSVIGAVGSLYGLRWSPRELPRSRS
jgi:hypothetical protein